MAICNACDRTIEFGRTQAGKLMPIDPERRDRTDTTANLAAWQDHTGRINVRVLGDGEEPEPFEYRAMPHFATCPKRVAERDARAGRMRGDGVIPFPTRASRNARRRR